MNDDNPSTLHFHTNPVHFYRAYMSAGKDDTIFFRRT